MFNPFRKKPKPAPPELIPDTGGRTVYAIGDVHGRLDLLNPLLDRILADARTREAPMLIMLGDYVDRGPDSKGVIDRLIDLAQAQPIEMVCLKGNHEQVMLSFMEDPVRNKKWLTYGGREALQSYGVMVPQLDAKDAQLQDCADSLGRRIGPHLAFLRDLPLWRSEGNYLFVHAGVRPETPLEEQVDEDFMWIRGEFLKAERHGLPYRVVHGHTPIAEVHIGEDRISLDTKAYASDVLSAARITDGEVEIFDTAHLATRLETVISQG